jgi:GntR family transcriptional regulator
MYSQLKDILLKKIESGEYPEGGRIPSEEELCERYGISRPTVRQAVTELSAGGYLLREKGRGTFVNKRENIIRIRKFSGLTGSVLAEVYPSEQRQILNILRVSLRDHPFLSPHFPGIPDDSRFTRTEYLAETDGTPFARIISYIPESLFPEMAAGLSENKSMVELLKGKYPYLPHMAKATLEHVSASAEDSGLMQIQPGVSLFRMTSILHARGGQVVEVVVSLYRADRCHLLFEQTAH